jgi:hypothetical protein
VTDNHLTLQTALATGRLSDFMVQEEGRGIGPIDRAEFENAAAKMIKAPRPKDQTSRSASGGNSSGKKTHRDIDQGAAD